MKDDLVYFCNEIEALKAYVNIIFGSNISSSLSYLQRIQKSKRSTFDDRLIKRVDLNKRISVLSQSRLDLLIDRYVLKKKGRVIAEELNISFGALGGKLSQARRELKRLLKDLLPSKKIEKNKVDRRVLTQSERDDLDMINAIRKKKQMFDKRFGNIKERIDMEIHKSNLYKLKEVSSVLRVSVRTLRRYCSTKIFKNAIYMGKQWLVPGCDIIEICPLLEKNKGESDDK